MSYILKMLSSGIFTSRQFKTASVVIILLWFGYTITKKYHYNVIDGLKADCVERHRTVNSLRRDIKVLNTVIEENKQKAKNKLSTVHQNCIQQRLNQTIESIEKESDNETTETSNVGRHTVSI